MSYKAALFDMDGTLLDTLADICDAMNAALARDGFPEHELEAYRYFVGNGVVVLAQRTLPEGSRTEKQVKRSVAAFREIYDKNWAVKTRPYPGVEEMLEALEQKNMFLTILSNKPDDYTKMMVDHYFPTRRFQIVLGATPERPRKPDPATALEIAETLGLAPEEFLYLGDTAVDMQTAVAAGMFPVGASWGFRPVRELEENGARKIIHQPGELVALL